MLKVYLEARVPGWKLHSLYDSLLRFPPEGVEFRASISDGGQNDGSFARSFDGHLSGLSGINELLDLVKPGLYYAYYRAKRRPKRERPGDLVYSSQHLIFDSIPWIVDLEFASALVGYGRLRPYRGFVERMLSSKHCRKIIPWTDAGARSLKLGLNSARLEEKIETVHLAVAPKQFLKKEADEKVRLLFVGTGNEFNLLRSFELKGGREVLLAFGKLQEEYSNLELTVRSHIPRIYGDFCAKRGIRNIASILSPSQLAIEFQRADIFLFPSHQTPGSVILDAMSYGLPVVTTNVWSNDEMVRDGETGLLIRASRHATYFGKFWIALW